MDKLEEVFHRKKISMYHLL